MMVVLSEYWFTLRVVRTQSGKQVGAVKG